jgi:hypothetical protein
MRDVISDGVWMARVRKDFLNQLDPLLIVVLLKQSIRNHGRQSIVQVKKRSKPEFEQAEHRRHDTQSMQVLWISSGDMVGPFKSEFVNQDSRILRMLSSTRSKDANRLTTTASGPARVAPIAAVCP